MPFQFGSHMSIAGGLHLAAERAREATCDCVQIFTKNNNQWKCKPLSEQDCERFQQSLREHSIKAPIAHTSYLINIASPDDALWQKSMDALVVEWKRADRLQLDGLVLHPGAYTKSTPEEGLQRVVQAASKALQAVQPAHCRLLLENTAGQGTCLGWQIEQLGWLLKQLDPTWFGICWDTCHAFAAGYDFRSQAGLRELISQLRQHGMLEKMYAIHLNDSKRECGSRVDRHEHIGLGEIGEEGIARFIRSRSFRNIPMYLETAKGTDEDTGEDWDVRNLRVLRQLSRGG